MPVSSRALGKERDGREVWGGQWAQVCSRRSAARCLQKLLGQPLWCCCVWGERDEGQWRGTEGKEEADGREESWGAAACSGIEWMNLRKRGIVRMREGEKVRVKGQVRQERCGKQHLRWSSAPQERGAGKDTA